MSCRWVVVLAIAGCTSVDTPLPPPRPVTPPLAPQVAPVRPVSIARIDTHGEWGLSREVCLHATTGSADCLSLTWDGWKQRVAKAPHARLHDLSIELTRDGAACTLVAGTLTCAGTPPIRGVEVVGTAQYVMLRSGDRLWWYENALDIDAPGPQADHQLHDMAPLPGGVTQLAVAFRAACAIAGDRSVWCWNDPRHPRRARVPAGTVEVLVQDPFELCARTAAGAVTCGPALAVDDLACDKRSSACGSVIDTDRPMRGRFEPLTALLGPQRPVALGHAVARLVRDDTRTTMACIGNDVLRVAANAIGGCAIGAAGELTCFAPCGSTWDVYRITGLPAVAEVWVGTGSGYARTTDGALYAWPNPDRERQHGRCAPFDDVAAVHLADGVVQLTAPIELPRGPNWAEPVRCAIVERGAGVRCWYPERDGTLVALGDPRALPAPSKPRP